MSVVIETTIGDITVDLYLKERPRTCLNFLKLCKMKYYNLSLFHKVERNFIAQAGDPTATGRGGESIFSFLYGEQAKYFESELKPRKKHEKIGTLSMVNNGSNMNGSQFFLTLGENLTYLDEVHTVFGEVSEGFEILLKINEIICDQNSRPYQDIRITHTVILHDPYDDPAGLAIPDASPLPTKEMLETDYIAPDEEIDDTEGKNVEEIEEKIKDSEAKAKATILEMLGDIPDAEVKPPENVLFVCKLNPVTSSEDLELIFSRFGTIVSCEVIKDKKSGESLQYAFIEFEKEEDCENAYFKMDNVLIDDRRIHVDFSQSVAKLNWNQNKVGKGKPGRFQNFVLKTDAKKSDGYEMVFVSDDDSYNRKGRNNDKHKDKLSYKRSHHSSQKPQSDKYSSKSADRRAAEKKYLGKSKRSRSRSRSPSHRSKSQYSSKSSQRPQHRSQYENQYFSTNIDKASKKRASRHDSYSSDSSPSQHSKSKASNREENHHDSSRKKKSSQIYDDSYKSVGKTKSSYSHRSESDFKSHSPKQKSKKSSEDNSYSKLHNLSSLKDRTSSRSHLKSSKSKKKKRMSSSSESDSSSSSDDEYISKKSSKSSAYSGSLKDYKESKHSRKRSPSPYSKSTSKSSDRHRDKKCKYSKKEKYNSSSSDSESNYKSKSSKSHSSSYNLSEKSNRRRRSSS